MNRHDGKQMCAPSGPWQLRGSRGSSALFARAASNGSERPSGDVPEGFLDREGFCQRCGAVPKGSQGFQLSARFNMFLSALSSTLSTQPG